MDYVKQFNSLMNEISAQKGQRISDIFKDFCQMAAISLAQPFYKSEKLEAEYMEVIGKYSKEEANKFPRLLTIVVLALEEHHRDFLGEVFMSNDMGNDYRGQFFTPYPISKLMAELVEPSETDTLCEPCVGSGGMVIAAHEVNPNICFVEATDIDLLCFFMAYIQLSLYGIPARIVHGNTLSMELFRDLYTPGYFLTGRHHTDKMKRLFAQICKPQQEDAAPTPPGTPSTPQATPEQLTLWDWA